MRRRSLPGSVAPPAPCPPITRESDRRFAEIETVSHRFITDYLGRWDRWSSFTEPRFVYELRDDGTNRADREDAWGCTSRTARPSRHGTLPPPSAGDDTEPFGGNELVIDARPYHAAVTTGELYRAVRSRMLELAAGLSREQSELPVPALPGWSVKDAYAHLSGLCSDILDARMEGAGTAAWTAEQVAARSPQDLADVCAEWHARGPALDAWLAEHAATFVAFDVWNHQQDVRSAVGLLGDRGPAHVDYLVAEAVSAFDTRFREAGAPALRVVTEGVDRTLGEGPPEATLTTTDYELVRILFGRRSLTQITNAGWTGDPTPYLDHLHLFDPPVTDLTD